MPLTRSATKASLSSVGSLTQPTDTKTPKTESGLASFLTTLDDLRDDSPLCGRDAKALRDATSSALEQVWNDSRETAALLTRRINEGNTTLTQRLNESFAEVGRRLDNLPVVAMFQPESQSSRVVPFSGYTEDGAQFSTWLQRLEDIIRMRPGPLSDEQRANFLIGHLEGVAREKVDELTEDTRKSYASVVGHLRAFFESPQQRYVARQKLSTCRQESGESCTAFANRVLNLVRAATSGQDAATQKERVLEEFVARLRGDIRYFVKLENPTSFEQAVTKAQTVEQLLNEAAAERLIHPASSHAPVQVLSRPDHAGSRNRDATRPEAFRRGPSRQGPPTAPRPQRQWRASTPIRTVGGPRCFNCNGNGHYSAVCPSPRMQSAPQGWPREPSPANTKGKMGQPRRLPHANALTWDPPTPSDTPFMNPILSSKAQLSASLEESQRQLQQSQARIAALLQRNEELTQSSAFSSSPNRTVPPSSLPDVRLLLFTTVSLLMFATPASAINAWLCPPDHSTTFFLPSFINNCSNLFPNSSTPSIKLSLHLYRPNTKLYSTSATLCKIIRHSVTYSVSFFGVPTEPLTPVHAGAIFDKVYLDLSGPYHLTTLGNKYIICLIDHFSKFVITAALPDCTALTVAQAIVTRCILVFGSMTVLVSDNAAYLKGELLTELGRLLQIGRYFTTPYHHEGNGACERVFATFQEMLRTYINRNQNDWDLFLPACTLAYNTSVHSSTNESPFFLMFGRDPVLNIDLLLKHRLQNHIPSDEDISIYKESLVTALHGCWTDAAAYNTKRSEAMKRQYDRGGLSPLNIKVGDRVYLRDFAPKPGLSAKLCYPWLGQFRVLQVDPPHLTIASITAPQAQPKRVHMNQVKRCFTLSGPVFTSPWRPEMEEQSLSSAHAAPVQIIGYNHTKLDPQQFRSGSSEKPSHPYNTRFRSRLSSV